MDAIAKRAFVNELKNKIDMAVTITDTSVKISASGPTSEVEHEWTHQEMIVIFELIHEANTKYAQQENKNQDPN